MKANWKIILSVVVVFVLVFGINYLLQPKKINRNSKLEDVTFTDKKINIYFFWGNGCPHCEHLFEFLESNQKDYKKYYNIYAFEVWDNKNNYALMQEFAGEMNEKITGVPYLIIGEKTFNGYSAKDNEDILNAIKEQYETRDSIRKFESIIKKS